MLNLDCAPGLGWPSLSSQPPAPCHAVFYGWSNMADAEIGECIGGSHATQCLCKPSVLQGERARTPKPVLRTGAQHGAPHILVPKPT